MGRLYLFPDLADHVQRQYVDTLCDLMVQKLTLLSQENEKLLDNQTTDLQQGIGMHRKGLEEANTDVAQIRGSSHGQQKGVEEENSLQPMDNAIELSKEKHGMKQGNFQKN